MMLSRRRFITGTAAVFAAPAIVRAESIMRIVVPKPVIVPSLYAELTAVTRKAFIPRLYQNLYFASPTLHYLMEHAK